MKRMNVLIELIQKYDWKLGVELGVAEGKTFFSLLDNFPKLTLIGIDLWTYYMGIGDKHSTGFESYHKADQCNFPSSRYERVIIKAAQYKKRAIIWRINTIEAAEMIDDKSMDFIFIDADHRRSFILADIAAWLPKVKDGGMLLGHDYHFPSVNSAVQEVFPEHELFDDNVWGVKIDNLSLKAIRQGREKSDINNHLEMG